MADLTPEVLAEWRSYWADLKELGGQDVIITPEFAIALLDELAMREGAKAIGLQLVERVKQEKALRKQAEARANGAETALLNMNQAWTAASSRAEKAEAELAEWRKVAGVAMPDEMRRDNADIREALEAAANWKECAEKYDNLRSTLQVLRDSAEADWDCPTYVTRALEKLL